MDEGQRPVRVGLVGYGYWGPKLARNFHEIPQANLVRVVDKDPGRLAKVAAAYPGIQLGDDYADVLASDIEAVVLATPIRSHYPLAKAALEAGKHVLVEKPLTAGTAEARALTALAEERGLILMVGHTFVYNAAIRTLRDIVASGELGRIYYVDAARLNLGLFQPDINVLWDLAPHDLSILCYVLGQEPLEVSARGSASVRPGIHDVAYVDLQFPANVMAHLHLSWLEPCKVRRVTIVGSKKMVVCNDLLVDEPIRIYDKGVDPPHETDQFSAFHLQYRYGGVRVPYVPFKEPLRTQCEHFLECIRAGTRSQSDGRVGTAIVRILEEADRSLQGGGTRRFLVPESLASAALSDAAD
jgi:predicted dehydrogenase